MDRTIRVLVANRPKLMRELILETLAEEPRVEIVGEVSNESEISDRVLQTKPDLLVIALEEPGIRPRVCDLVLREHPQMRIIAVAADQNRSTGYWASFDIHSGDIEPSEAGFLNAVISMTAQVGGVS